MSGLSRLTGDPKCGSFFPTDIGDTVLPSQNFHDDPDFSSELNLQRVRLYISLTTDSGRCLALGSKVSLLSCVPL
jgi:hypothetical protein